jgi:hypothetical protein
LQIYAKATKPTMVCEREVGTKCPDPFIMGEGDWKDGTDQGGQTKEDNDSYVVRLELWIDNGKNNKPSNFSNNWRRLVNVDEDHTGKRWLQNT